MTRIPASTNVARELRSIGETAGSVSRAYLGSEIFSAAGWGAIGEDLHLSAREVSIMRGLLDNEIELAIADRLGITRRTVHTHLERVHRKLGVTSRTQLVVRLMETFLRLTECGAAGLPALCPRRSAGQCPELPQSCGRPGVG